MSQKQGLEIYKADGTLMFDLTTRIPKYIGAVDIYPTSSNAECEGYIQFPNISSDWPSTFCVIDRVYASGVSVYGNIANALPHVNMTKRNNVLCLHWHYQDFYSWNYSQQVNLPVRAIIGVF